jgi:hypothetical protein
MRVAASNGPVVEKLTAAGSSSSLVKELRSGKTQLGSQDEYPRQAAYILLVAHLPLRIWCASELNIH